MKRALRLASFALLGLLLAGGVWFCASPAVHAQVNEGLSAVAPTIRLSSADPRVIAARIINVALGLLGIIFLGLVIYAGFLWMTSGGNSENTEKAKTLLRNAVIGLIIILSSWAITRYVLTNLLNATREGNGIIQSDDGGNGGGGGFGSGGGAFSSFQLRSITPTGSVPLRNVVVRFVFTRDVDPASATRAISVRQAGSNAVVAGTVSVSGAVVEFTPSTSCPNMPTRFCFEGDTDFVAVVDRTLSSLSTAGEASQRLVCGGLARACQDTFRTGNQVDITPPTGTILVPFDGQSVSQNEILSIITRAQDDVGVSYVSSSADGRGVGVVSPSSTSPLFIASIPWSVGAAATGTHILHSSIHDLDSHLSSGVRSVTVSVRPAHCFNGRQDQDETGLDCGGSSCGRCSSGGNNVGSTTCRQGADCRSGVCQAGTCVEQPVILGVSPDNGKPGGTLVTISGANFGRNPGQVRFWDGNGFGAIASVPTVCAAGSSWTSNQIIIGVPDGARSGPIQITNASSSLSDATNDTNGPVLDNFTINNVAHPGLCAVTPSLGERGDLIALTGVDLSSSGRIFFTDRDVTPSSFNPPWSPTRVSLNVPIVPAGRYAVRVRVGGQDSNAVSFNLIDPVRGNPIIDDLSPGSGPIGEYVTLLGRNFGTTPGRVVFRNQRTGEQGNADVTFPAACTRDFWRDTAITVKVPPTVGLSSAVTPDAYRIFVIRQADGIESNRMNFSVVSGTPRPGICSIAPLGGPVGTVVTLTGERFGSRSDTVTFQGSTAETRVNASTASRWTESAITTTVPTGAYSGRVRVLVGSTSSSNSVNFAVRNCTEDANMCGAETCCRDSGQCSVGGVCAAVAASSMYGWELSTGQLPFYPEVVEECAGRAGLPPSPSPWDGRTGGNGVCVNAEMVIRFNTIMDRARLTSNTIVVSRCTGTGANPCSSKERMTGGRFEINDAQNSATSRQTLVTYTPAAQEWSASSTYDIALTTDITSQEGVAMRPQADRCGPGNAYCFRFTTATSTVPCRLGAVGVTPSPFTAQDLGEQVAYRSSALSAEDQCIQINPVNIGWRWYTGRSITVPDSRATLAAYGGSDCTPIPGRAPVLTSGGTLTHCPWRQIATAQNETGPTQPVLINAEGSNIGDPAVTGTAPLYIQFIPPEVVGYGPNCNAACTEAKIWAEFNVPMDPDFATNRQVLLYKCANENCRSFSPSTPLVLPSGAVTLVRARGVTGLMGERRRLEIDPVNTQQTSYLEPGAFYKVILKGDADPSTRDGFRSRTGLALTGLNDRQGFAWRFRVKEDNRGLCDITRVDVLPLEKVETVVAARELFSAEPVSVSQACGEQPLMSRASFAWTSEFADVSRFVNARGNGFIDTNPALPANCSGRCLNLGSEGVQGRIASCGNSLVETTDASTCQRPNGAVCTSSDTDCVVRLDAAQRCRVLPAGASGGEECDLGNASQGGLNGVNGSLCTSSCLWAGVSGGTCGDARLQAGEQCDPGKVCVGGDRVGQTCLRDNECTGGGRCQLNLTSTGCSETCLALGSGSVTTIGEDSQCGNGSLGAGEACDDGNLLAGDGCSPECLHEGSRAVAAVCGNRILESGESCERGSDTDGTWPARCNRTTCLNEGTLACTTAGRENCCGNGAREAGEDCDDNNLANGDGCSNRCLAEGSSIAYQPNPSICGDTFRTAGEQCEAARSDVFTDSRQLSQIVGEHEPDAQGRMMSRVRATYRAKTGEASHGLQCGFREERECIGSLSLGRRIEDYGLTTNGCCMARPIVTRARFPLPATTNVCRNTGIYLGFSQLMNEASVRDNVIIAQEVSGACPNGTQAVEPTSLYPGLCAGGVTGTIQFERDGAGTRALFSLDHALQASSRYRVIVRGDADLSNAVGTGVRNLRGTVMAGDVSWSFSTGNRICTANTISIRDTNPEHPYLFQVANESHAFSASVMSTQDGRVVPISSVQEYGWSWQPWLSSETRVLTVGATVNDTVAQQASTSTIQAHNRTGSSLIFAGVRIDRDTVNVPPSTGITLEASHIATVSLCQRPWPAADPRYDGALLFSDSRPRADESSMLTGTIFENGPYYNFATNYCMDEGSSATLTDDLPPLTVRPTPPSSADAARGLLRQYLFTFDQPEIPPVLRKDAIGIRVFSNPLHLSARSWYTAQGFSGSPSALTVDGYDAIKDGDTLYVAAPNVSDATRTSPVTSTIYLISRNPDAEEQTRAIYDQLVQNWVFNVNVQEDSSNVCKTPQRTVYLDRRRVVACSSDWECASYGDSLTCASFKAKIQRDGQRLADFQSFMTRLESARTRDGRYPTIADGSYLQGITNSRWGSWQAVLGQALGNNNLPIDPVNRFLTCGRCQYPGSTTVGEPCMDASDCSVGGVCAGIPRAAGSAAAYDPPTCWEVANRRFMCPRLPSGPSRFYQYRSFGAGAGYELSTELEAASYDRYRPALAVGTSRCTNTGQLCQTSDQCITYYAGTARESSRGTCQPTGGQWRYENVCTGREFGIDAVCGNGIRSTGEACEAGDTATAACETVDGRPGMKQQVCSPTCQGFVDGSNTRCVALGLCGNGRVDRYLCAGSGVKYGLACTSPTAEGSPSPECSDARDPSGANMRCVSISSIPRAGAEETCDDGALNGTYGHCNRACTGFDATCGDGELSPGELCDTGSRNGQYCDTRSAPQGDACVVNQSCGFDCRTRAPYCGDGAVQSADGEVCEPGQLETTTKALCMNGPFIGRICNNDSDCSTESIQGDCGRDSVGANGVLYRNFSSTCENYRDKRCIGAGSICSGTRTPCRSDQDCAELIGGVGGSCLPRAQLQCSRDSDCGVGGRCNAYPTQRTRVCGPGNDDRTAQPIEQCQWASWSACQPAATCGDGRVDAGEDCDDGNLNDNDACTSVCRANICGDGLLQTGVEQCDYGDASRGGRNGAACSSEYGATCATCTSSCRVQAQSGGFCGNGIRDGREQCDSVGSCTGGTNARARCTNDAVCGEGGRCVFDGVANDLSCRSIGYDYANASVCTTAPYVTNADGSVACINTTGRPEDCQVCTGSYRVSDVSLVNFTGVQVDGGACRRCPGPTNAGVPSPCTAHESTTQFVTVANQSSCLPGSIRDILSCSSSCGFAGCGSCLAQPSPENSVSIQGEVYDQVAGVAIPGARILVTYRGNTVVDTVTDTNGRFVAANLHGRAECGQYRLAISFERDNPLTPAVVESLGYRPFDSGVFSPVDFRTRIATNGRIGLTPRTSDGDTGASDAGLQPTETRVSVTWSGQLPLVTVQPDGRSSMRVVRGILPHLILPESRRFYKTPSYVGRTLACYPGESRTVACQPVPSAIHAAGTFQGIPSSFACSVLGRSLSSLASISTNRPYITSPQLTCGYRVRVSDGFDDFLSRAVLAEEASSQTPTAVLCCPSRAQEATVRRAYPYPITTQELDQALAQACCRAPLQPSGGTIVGYPSSAVCNTNATVCSADAGAGQLCCRRDIGSGSNWQGSQGIRNNPNAYTRCSAHAITTDAECTRRRNGTGPGEGPTGALTRLACTPNNSCDEYVRTSTPDDSMSLQYLRSEQSGDTYAFYLEQVHYAQREFDANPDPPGAHIDGTACGEVDRVLTCSGSPVVCRETNLPPGATPMNCPGDVSTCTGLAPSVCIKHPRPDLRATLSTPSRLFRDIGLEVKVYTSTGVTTIRPPQVEDGAVSCPSGISSYLWHVFNQDARTGAVTTPDGSTGRWVCDPPANMTGLKRSVLTDPYHFSDSAMQSSPYPTF